MNLDATSTAVTLDRLEASAAVHAFHRFVPKHRTPFIQSTRGDLPALEKTESQGIGVWE